MVAKILDSKLFKIAMEVENVTDIVVFLRFYLKAFIKPFLSLKSGIQIQIPSQMSRMNIQNSFHTPWP